MNFARNVHRPRLGDMNGPTGGRVVFRAVEELGNAPRTPLKLQCVHTEAGVPSLNNHAFHRNF